MSFLDEFGESVVSIAKDVGEKAKELSGTAKIHANIKAEEIRIQDLYYKLGKKYYEVYQDTPDTEVTQFVDRINEANEKIAEYRKELDAAKSQADVVVNDVPSEDDVRAESEVVGSAAKDADTPAAEEGPAAEGPSAEEAAAEGSAEEHTEG